MWRWGKKDAELLFLKKPWGFMSVTIITSCEEGGTNKSNLAKLGEQNNLCNPIINSSTQLKVRK